MSDFPEIKRKAGEYLGLPGFPLRRTIVLLIDIIEKQREAFQRIQVMRYPEKMRELAHEALKLTEE